MINVENKDFIFYRNLCFLLFLVDPILKYLQIPGANTIVSLIFISVFVYLGSVSSLFRHVAALSPMLIWLVLTIYSFLNGYLKQVPEVNIIDLLHGLKIYSCLVIFTFLGKCNFKYTVKALLYCFIIYLLLCLGIVDTSNSELDGRMSGVIYATGLGQRAAILCVYIAFYALLNKLKIAKITCMLILPLIVILLVQSRNALAMMGIVIIGLYVARSMGKRNFGKLITTLVLVAVLFWIGFNVVIENTSLGERFIEGSENNSYGYIHDYGTGTLFDKIVGDRLSYYVYGWRLFIDSPLTGIGMWMYKYAVDGIYPLHSEYMIHLCEGGIIGASLYLLFLIHVVKYIGKNRKYPTLKVLAVFSFVELLFCGIYAREFYYEFFYPVYGLIFALGIIGAPNYQIQITNNHDTDKKRFTRLH